MHSPTTVPEANDDTRTAGRGLISIAAAKVYFIIASYSVQLALPRLWDAHEFGRYAAAIAGASILNNVLIAATIQSVSKFVSEDDAMAPARLRQGLHIQLVVSLVLGAAFFLAGPSLAAFLGDPSLGPLFQITSLVVFSYGLYAALVGSLNGRRLFQRQAGLDITFSTLRTGAILTGATLGFGVTGALTGFAAAAVAILAIALLVVGWGASGERLPIKRWLGFMAPIWAYQAFLNGMLQADILVLKKTLGQLTVELASSAPSVEVVDSLVAYYRSAQTFAFVPYQLMLSMTFIVFPMVSRATSAGDDEATQRTIRAALRFSLLVLLGIAAPMSGAADGVMLVAYPMDYVIHGAPALKILVFGMVAFALFVICATIVSGAGRPAVSAAIALVSVGIVIVLNAQMIRVAPIGAESLIAAATATSVGTTTAMFAALIVVWRLFGASLGFATIARALIAAAVGYIVAGYTPHDSRLMAIVALAAGFGSYCLCLFALRELQRSDIQAAIKVLRR